MSSKKKTSIGFRVNATDLTNINTIRRHFYVTKGIFYDTSTAIRLAIERMSNELGAAQPYQHEAADHD